MTEGPLLHGTPQTTRTKKQTYPLHNTILKYAYLPTNLPTNFLPPSPTPSPPIYLIASTLLCSTLL